jgi:hypothetical protein
MSAIKADLEQAGMLGLNEVLVSTGFKVNIDFAGEIKAIDFFYSKCVEGLDGTLQEVSSHIKTFTNADKRQDRNSQGVGLMEEVEIPVLDDESNEMLDEEGNTITQTVTRQKMIGVIDFWRKMVGDAVIIPDLKTTLDSRVSQYKRL